MKLRLSPVAEVAPAVRPHQIPAPCVDIEALAGESLSRALWLSGKLRPLRSAAGWAVAAAAACVSRGMRPCPARRGGCFFSAGAGSGLADGLSPPGSPLCPLSGLIPGPGSVLELELPPEDFAAEVDEVSPGNALGAKTGRELALAVDLGTTSVYWRALETDSGAAVALGHFLNPQAGAGADVVSRLAVAREPGGRARLAGWSATRCAVLWTACTPRATRWSASAWRPIRP